MQIKTASALPEPQKTIARGNDGVTRLNRRQFFKLSGIAGGGLVLGLGITQQQAKAQELTGGLAEISPYVQIQSNGRINIFSKNPECGQGIKTGLPLIIAEELDARWEDVDVVQADIDASKFGFQMRSFGHKQLDHFVIAKLNSISERRHSGRGYNTTQVAYAHLVDFGFR